AACQPACRAGACATPTVCEQTNATPAPAGKRALDVACRGSGAGGEFCAAQAFVPSAGAADSRAVTKRLQKAIASDGSVTFRLRLNKYGKKLLKRARRERRSLLVIVRIALGTRDATAFLLREVELGA
ncbi:MAG TPA: hypothetical protein VKA21_00550, partial [Candidatus Binatia bacterium]|nr:hypothetical protein [Candidatus Binatia bacterium]